jgi:hypothetical protein
MRSRSVQHSACSSTVALAAIVVSLMPLSAQAQGRAGVSDPFAGLSGSWSGGGSITLSSGATERLRCRASYASTPGSADLQLSLRCNSDSYEFDLRSRLQYEGGAIAGSWIDATRNVTGSISGRASTGQIQGVVQGPGFTASLSLATRGNRQNVTIRSAGTELSQVSVALTRAGR